MNNHKKTIRTMQEFSDYVGISRPTVSKFFNDPSSVRASTREKLEAAVKALNFQPNMLAVNFKKKRTNIIGVIIPDATDPFYASFTQHVTHIAHQSGLITMVLSSDGDSLLQTRAISTMMGMQVAGVIFVPTGVVLNQQEMTQLTHSIPTIFFDAYNIFTRHFVGTDNVQSMRLIIEYLVRSGSSPCYFPMPLVNHNALLRHETYLKVMEQLGYEAQVVSTSESLNWGFEAFAYQQTELILAQGGFPSDTVLCANDRIAYGVIAACHAAGLTIGCHEACDLRIAGHDDHPLARYTCPPLTTVRQNTTDLAAAAMKMLLQLVQANTPLPPQKMLLDATLQLRASA